MQTAKVPALLLTAGGFIMAILIGIESILRVTLEAQLHGQRCLNVFHFMNQTEMTDAAIEDIINNRLLGEIAAYQSDEVLWTLITVQSLWPVLTEGYQEAKSYPGGTAGEALPPANAGIVSMRTGFGGKRNRGRKYIFGLGMNNVTNGEIDSTFLATIQGRWDTMQASFGPTGTEPLLWGILHKTFNGNPVPINASAFVGCSQVIVRRGFGTMRSRLPGHGS